MITFQNLGRMGRLGNQMFEIASTIGIAVKSGQDYAFPYWMNYDAKERFGSIEDIDVQKYFKNPLPILEDPDRYRFTEIPYYWGYRDEYFPQGNFNLNAHMQSEKFFLHCQDLIRHYFEMKDEYEPEESPHLAIHIRFGDYDNYYHPFTTTDYLKKALSEFEKNRVVYLFSDDLVRAADLLRPLHNNFYSRPSNYLDEFKRMKACKDFIICNSTYSWWAAWLGKHPDKKVVCPKKWHGDHTGLDPTDLYSENWIII